MKYISTRGRAPELGFEEAVLTGLASDGGLYVPAEMPQFSAREIASFSGLSYQELAFRIMSPFVDGEISDSELKQLIEGAYSTFDHAAIAPLTQLDQNLWVLELFHGPTLAFKDFALQFLGRLFDLLLKRRNQRAAVMGATSGDTGSAAIEGCRHCDNLDIFILHPHGRISEVQRRQMTTVLSDNVRNIAMKGNFDDCQNMVKASFADQSFLPEDRQLVAINSINWARIMAQIVYYFYAALALGAPHRKVSFAVPTGNFGDIYAGYLAKRMGLPVDRLVIGTNQNDILHRCISDNDHSVQSLIASVAPSMDIMISSNFERLLFDLYQRDGQAVAGLMQALKDEGGLKLNESALGALRSEFDSRRLDDEGMLNTIKNEYDRSSYLLDPHTAVGVAAGRGLQEQDALKQDVSDSVVPVICLSTAHPAKFPESVRRSGYPQDPLLPPSMADLYERQEACEVLENNLQTVQSYIAANIRQ